MCSGDPWLPSLRRQAAIVEGARIDLAESRRTNWRVLQAELTLESVEDAYHRLLTDAPRLSVLRHLRERVSAVRA